MDRFQNFKNASIFSIEQVSEYVQEAMPSIREARICFLMQHDWLHSTGLSCPNHSSNLKKAGRPVKNCSHGRFGLPTVLTIKNKVASSQDPAYFHS
jgi:hypothetical protein